MASSLKGKQLADHYFTRDDPSGISWTCKCGVTRLQKGSGYSNLCSHIVTEHPDYIQLVDKAKKVTTITEVFWPKKAQNIHGWMDMIIMGLLPFSFVENESAKKYMRPEGVTVNTLKKYIHLVEKRVRHKLTKELPDLFALVFDGWSAAGNVRYSSVLVEMFQCVFPSHLFALLFHFWRAAGNVHFVAVFATFPSVSSEHGYSKVLLSFSPMGEGDELTAEMHHTFVSDVLHSYGKSWSNVAALVGDNCSTNKLFAKKADCKLIGCASHRFNLAVKDIMSPYEDLLAKVNSLMKKLRNIIPSAKLRKLTHLKPKSANATRWSSTFHMLQRYAEIKTFLHDLEMNDIYMIFFPPIERTER